MSKKVKELGVKVQMGQISHAVDELDAEMVGLEERLAKVEEAICPRVAARLTALERMQRPAPLDGVAIKYTLLLQAVNALIEADDNLHAGKIGYGKAMCVWHNLRKVRDSL